VSLQQSYYWTTQSTTKLLLNPCVYNKIITEPSSLHQSYYRTIEFTTKLLLNHWVYNKLIAEPSSLHQSYYWTTESTTKLLLNHYKKWISCAPVSVALCVHMSPHNQISSTYSSQWRLAYNRPKYEYRVFKIIYWNCKAWREDTVNTTWHVFFVVRSKAI
jgi:hypothetical protein